MDERLEKALDFANFLDTQNNQKRIFHKQYQENLIHYTNGCKFTVTPELINLCITADRFSKNEVVLVDDNNTPLTVTDPIEFAKELFGVYVFASRKYASDYESIKTSRSVEGLVDL